MVKLPCSGHSDELERIHRLGFLSIFTIISCLLLFFKLESKTSMYSYHLNQSHHRQPECACRDPTLKQAHANDSPSSLCNPYATRRGPHQRIIAISLFGQQESGMFQLNHSLTFLRQLIDDINNVYPDGYILRIYHDKTVSKPDVICPFECRHPNVDFCDVTHLSYIPPKIWRFLPAGDPLVDLSESARLLVKED